jgi:hypothetical protein
LSETETPQLVAAVDMFGRTRNNLPVRPASWRVSPGAGWHRMFAKLKAAWDKLIGGRSGSSEEPPEPAIDYKGYRIRAAPYRNNGQYQTAGTIEKDAADGMKSHRFVRADMHHSRDDAVAFTISKAKQIIDLQGDRIFA